MSRRISLVLLVVLAGGGLFGGASLLADPDGSTLGLDLDLLPDWYPSDYRWAGLALLVLFGLGGSKAAWLVARRHPRASLATIGIGLALLAWMLLQIAMIGLALPPMQITFLLVGATLTLTGRRITSM